MRDFALLFRQPNHDHSDVSPKELDAIAKKWKGWIENIASQGKLVSPGTRLDAEGKVLKARGVITDGPFVEIREVLGGLTIIKAEDMDEATTLAHGCPILDYNGSVEVRPVWIG